MSALVGSAIFIGVGLIICLVLIGIFGKKYQSFSRAESIYLIIIVTTLGTFCCWLFWFCVYAMQLYPMIQPIRHDFDL